ncbi:porin [Pseudoflavitalea sp. G-6-1-2]|nr:porin [Pseudoflavitalea sp. G-6-1-2]
MDMIDTTKDMGRGMLSMFKRFDHIRIGGYMQPQYQFASEKGAKGYSGGDFSPKSNNRFMLRRGRVRFDYMHFNEMDQPTVQFAIQFDGTERGVNIRDLWGRVFENKWQMFMVTGGMFARPFGYEINLSSSDREAPERGRMSQILMRTERDLGAMVSFEPREKNHPLRYLKIDIGAFNGQGLTGPAEYDSYKDIIAHIGLKPYPLTKKLTLSGGVSMLRGGLANPTKYIYKMGDGAAGKQFLVDSSEDNVDSRTPREYGGADMQWKYKTGWGNTELRGEYWFGKQTGTKNSTETPGTLPNEPFYIRKFSGAFICFLQHIVNTSNQLVVKYDWYDPNTSVSGKNIGKEGTQFTPADIKYSTLGFGYVRYINQNLKLFLWYDRVTNESTSLKGYTEDLPDDVFTCRLQFRF